MMKWFARLGWAIGGFVAAALLAYYFQAQSLPDLQFWHQRDVALEVVPELEAPNDLDEYLEHEARIFTALDRFLSESDADLPSWHRYSAAAHAIYRVAWPEGNRSVLRTPEARRGAALLYACPAPRAAARR